MQLAHMSFDEMVNLTTSYWSVLFYHVPGTSLIFFFTVNKAPGGVEHEKKRKKTRGVR